MLKLENAAELCKRLRLPIPNQKALDLLPEELRNNPLFFPPDSIVEKCEAIQPVSDEISELYDRYWTQLTSG
jgi:spermidine/putrescine transport system substrate-binding protein